MSETTEHKKCSFRIPDNWTTGLHSKVVTRLDSTVNVMVIVVLVMAN